MSVHRFAVMAWRLTVESFRVLLNFSGDYRPRCVDDSIPCSDCSLAHPYCNLAKRQVSCPHPFHSHLIDLHSSRFKYGWLVPIAVLFVISFPPVRHAVAVPGKKSLLIRTCSYSVMKLLPFFAGLFGDSG